MPTFILIVLFGVTLPLQLDGFKSYDDCMAAGRQFDVIMEQYQAGRPFPFRCLVANARAGITGNGMHGTANSVSPSG